MTATGKSLLDYCQLLGLKHEDNQRGLTMLCLVQTAEKGKAVASADAFYVAEATEPVTDWQDYSNYYDEYDDDEEVSETTNYLQIYTCLLYLFLCLVVLWHSA